MPNFQCFLRKEGDSNPRFPLGEYTLSRRASSATRAPFQISECKSITFYPKCLIFRYFLNFFKELSLVIENLPNL